MATFIATLLKVESVTRKKARYDEQTSEPTVEDVTFGSNPEYACVPIEAKSMGDAKKQAQEILDGDLHGLGWTSFSDPDLWGKDMRVLVDVVAEDEHVKRSGRGNNPGNEGQVARFARYKKAAKV